MAFISDLRGLWQPGPGEAEASSRTKAALREQTEAFCAATTLDSQTGRLIDLFSGIFQESSERVFQSRLICWLDTLEQDADLRFRFQQGLQSTLGRLDSVSLFAEAGIPAQHALLREITSRLFQRWLPPPRAEDDTARLFAAVFCSARAVQRFLEMDAAVFARLAANLWSTDSLAAYPHLHQDLHEALRLLAARGCGFVPRLLEADPSRPRIVTTQCGTRVEHLDAERAKDLFAELELYGIRHDDPDVRNVTYRQSDGRFCVVDFEFATILTP